MIADLPPKPRRHRWFERPSFVNEETGVERHERVCEVCQMSRMTVIPPRGNVWVEWESANGEKSKNGPTPACVGENVVSTR